ncbi:MAG: flagellar basal body P-ring protein FlgI [Rhizobiales bacterium]|nr:flagellar basal body P-ring protein FlgI [Hyphomicrobiales bacterium]NRB13832.1 flagellar basal body P-ring protein FlgI [Hyphomicrobiales bacterium]
MVDIKIPKQIVRIIFLSFFMFTNLGTAVAASRIKDIVDIENIRTNKLIGYGLVVGLNGTGDNLASSTFTKQSMQTLLTHFGINAGNLELKSKNVAAVMITAELPAFAMNGTLIDVVISSIGDSKSLQGGVLLATNLLALNGVEYAVAQGPISIGGFKAEGKAATITTGIPTVGRIANGAIVEREMELDFAGRTALKIGLKNPDFTTAKRIARTINAFMAMDIAEALNPNTIQLVRPTAYRGTMVDLITEIEQLRVEVDQVAKVLIDEQTGVIVIGHNVRVSQVAIAQGNLTISITEAPEISQPAPFSQGVTTEAPRTEITIDDNSDNALAVLEKSISLTELVDGLNALGVGPRDLISILQSIKALGALQAELVVM